MLDAKALDAGQQDARAHTVSGEGVEHRIGEQPAVGAIALPEVHAHPHAVLDHQPAPSSRPSAAAPTPSTRLNATFAHKRQRSPSSARRWDSSIHVEKVV